MFTTVSGTVSSTRYILCFIITLVVTARNRREVLNRTRCLFSISNSTLTIVLGTTWNLLWRQTRQLQYLTTRTPCTFMKNLGTIINAQVRSIITVDTFKLRLEKDDKKKNQKIDNEKRRYRRKSRWYKLNLVCRFLTNKRVGWHKKIRHCKAWQTSKHNVRKSVTRTYIRLMNIYMY